MPLTNPDLQQFLTSRIGSVPALEVLLHMYRNPGREWTAEDIEKDLRMGIADIRASLNQFKNSSLAIERGRNSYRYNVFSSYDPLIKELHTIMKTEPGDITSLLNATFEQKVHSLSNAFRF